jgi:hypothetical protein
MSYSLCNFPKSNGIPCGSPAFRGQRFCYFHVDPDTRRLKTAWVRVCLALQVSKMRNRDSRRRLAKRKLNRLLTGS